MFYAILCPMTNLNQFVFDYVAYCIIRTDDDNAKWLNRRLVLICTLYVSITADPERSTTMVLNYNL